MMEKEVIYQEHALYDEIERLSKKLRDAEDLIDAIRNGRIDALVVPGAGEDSIYTLKGADHTYRILIETMDEGAVILSREGAILYCNRQFAKMLMANINHVIGNSISEFLDPQDRETFQALHDRAFAEKGAKAEIHLKAAQGDRIPTLISLRSLSMDDMNVLCLVVTDLTEQKKTEEILKAYSQRLYRQNAELKRRAEQMARLSSELTMAEQKERKRMSKILHDGLQQLLASAKLQISCMSEEFDSEQKQSVVEVEEILADSIKISRSLSMDLSPPILHEGGISAALEWLVRSMLEKHDMTVDLELLPCADLPEHVKVLAFESVRELLFNAVKHAKVKCAKVSLQQEDDNHVRITVSDTGAGFEVGRLESGQGSGGGFGLFSIRERISLIGGSLQIQSTPGQGSCFTLLFPSKMPTAAVLSDQIEQSIPPFGLTPPAQRTLTRVLLADDHTLFREGIARILSREEDIEVVGQATNGQEVINMARELRPHVILMDISMPGISGIEATAVIHREFPEIRIIGLSMYEDLERARVIYQAGAVDYKNKACAASELLSAVRA